HDHGLLCSGTDDNLLRADNRLLCRASHIHELLPRDIQLRLSEYVLRVLSTLAVVAISCGVRKRRIVEFWRAAEPASSMTAASGLPLGTVTSNRELTAYVFPGFAAPAVVSPTTSARWRS